MSVPTSGEKFAELLHHIREAQDCAAMLSHLESANDNTLLAQGWLATSEMFKLIAHQVTQLAMRKLQ